MGYEELVDLTLMSHDPTRAAYKTQYASLILTRDDAQLAVARQAVERFADLLGRPLVTRAEPLKRFWLAEDYHQKYHLRQDRVLMADFRAMFGSDEAAFRESTAVARANGFVAGDGTRMQLEKVIDQLGLSDAGRAELDSRVVARGDGIGCPIR